MRREARAVRRSAVGVGGSGGAGRGGHSHSANTGKLGGEPGPTRENEKATSRPAEGDRRPVLGGLAIDNTETRGGAATASSNASAAAGGMAIAKAVATGGVGGQPNFGLEGVANATSSAETAKARIGSKRQSTAVGSSGQALSNALTSYSYVKVRASGRRAGRQHRDDERHRRQGGGSGQASR